MKKTIWSVFALALLTAALMILTACAKPQAQPQQQPEAGQPEQAQMEEPAQADGMAAASSDSGANKAAVTFATRDLDGNAVTEAVFANAELTMLNVWATYCGPCLMEMPDLGELSKAYADQGVQIIGIVSDIGDSEADIASARKIIADTGANYTHLLPSEELRSGLLSGMMYVPTTVFFDRAGNQVDNQIVGSKSKGDW